MYSPPAFREERVEVLRSAMRAHPLATLITCGSQGLIANVLPFTLRCRAEGDVLCAHLAKGNGQLSDLRDRAPTLAIFKGPQAYVSPSWYASKLEHGKVVPTWNYVVVQVRGTPLVIDDETWLRDQIDELTGIHEEGRAKPWAMSDAPSEFLAGQLKGIVGLELPITSIEGKWKVSQNQSEQNRAGVVAGLRGDGLNDLADVVVQTTSIR